MSNLIKLAFVILFPFNVFAADKLIFAVDIVRHGDRTPIRDLPNFPYLWTSGMGELTPVGMQQEYNLGVMLRDKYMKQYKLLPFEYDSAVMYVRSSDTNRTLMSAQSLLIGLYPLGSGPFLAGTDNEALPSGFQPIPIHTVAKADDDLLLPNTTSPMSATLLNKYVFSSKPWQDKSNKVKDKLPRWSKITGLDIKTLANLISLGDTLYIRQLYGAPIPDGMTQSEVNEIINLGKWAFANSFKPSVIGDYFSTKLLNEIYSAFNVAAAAGYLPKASQMRYLLYVGHDSTVSAIMSALKVPLSAPPPYAANLNFSLWQDEKSRYTVTINYNGESIKIPACRKEVCTLSEVSYFVSTIPEVKK